MSNQDLYAEPDEMTLRDYLAVIRRRKWLVILPTVIVTAVALATSLMQANQYRATTQVLVTEPPTATNVGAGERTLQTGVLLNELQRAQGSEILDQVRERVGEEPALDVRLAAAEDVDILIFTGESTDAALAATAADAYADVYIGERRAAITADLQARITVVQDQLTSLTTQLEDADSEEERATLQVLRSQYGLDLQQLQTSVSLAATSGATVIDAAQFPESPFAPTPTRTGALALVLGLLLGLGAAFARDYFDNSVRDEDDLARLSRLPVLGVIPKSKDTPPGTATIISRSDPTSPIAEAYRAVRAGVQFVVHDGKVRALQVTSPRPGDGKTTTATNLAVAFARAGRKTLLIDCDLRRPRVHEFFGLRNDVGFTTIAVGGSLDEVLQVVADEANLSVITSGPILPDPSELLSGQTAARFLEMVRDEFDLVIVDSPPVLVVSDPLVISGMVDGVLLVTSGATGDRRDVKRAVEQLAQIDAPLIGTLLNAFEVTRSSYDYRYRYGSYEAAASSSGV